MTHVSNYHLAALARRRELWMRIGFAILIAMAAAYGARSAWPIGWFLLVCAAQCLNIWAGGAAARDPAFVPSGPWEARYLLVQCANSAAFASIAGFLWFAAGMEERLIALVVLMGAQLNFGTQAHASGRLLWWGSAPFIAMLAGLPLATILVEPHTSIVETGFLILGALLYLLHVLTAVRRREEASQETVAALERAEQASAAKSEFVATMSHEIRTPLNGVLGMAQAMANDPLPEPQRQRLEVIQSSGAILLTLLNDLLDIAKIEAGKLELEEGRLDIVEMAAQAREAFVALVADKDILLTVDATPDLSGLWRGDPVRVRQVLYNLMSNAIKFTERGAISAVIDLDEAGGVRITVQDTGPGIPDAQLAHLFGRFMQGDASTTRRFGGSGLGLAICRELARLMGGDLSVETVPGEGSTFTAHLPLLRSTETPVPEAHHDAAQIGGLQILVVEDNPTNQMVISTLLGQLGLTVHIVEDGAQACEAWRLQPWDLILMDIQMPVMDGIEATRRIRAQERAAGLGPTPIIALTANAMSHQRTQYETEGFDGVVAKPIRLDLLVAAINSVVMSDPVVPGDHAPATAC